jgi:hypothetical protein
MLDVSMKAIFRTTSKTYFQSTKNNNIDVQAKFVSEWQQVMGVNTLT